MRNIHTPADDNQERYEADIKRNKESFYAYYKDHANNSVFDLIDYLAEAMAYQYSLNRKKDADYLQLIKEIRAEGRECKNKKT